MAEKIVTIFGSGSSATSEQTFLLAEQTGRALAQAGFTIANGGYGGTMLAAAKGAAEAGGRTIGVTCRVFGRGSANKYISSQIVTLTLEERLKKLTELGRAYVVLPGGTGTLLELAFVWELNNKGFIKQARPIILVGEFWRPLAELVATNNPESGRYLQFADSADEIRTYLKELI